ncbi:ubiquitin-like-specific protease 1, partial [Scomber scombrus]
VKDAWEGKKVYVLLSKIGPYKIFFGDIHNTGPQREFESEVINAYLTLLVKKHNDENKDRAYALDSFEITRIWEGQKPKVKIVPLQYNSIVGIVNEGHHWMLV